MPKSQHLCAWGRPKLGSDRANDVLQQQICFRWTMHFSHHIPVIKLSIANHAKYKSKYKKVGDMDSKA